MGFVAIGAGEIHSLGLKADGSIAAWGANNYGQCEVPAPNTSFVAVAAGWAHSLGLRVDGSIMAWGYNGNGEVTGQGGPRQSAADATASAAPLQETGESDSLDEAEDDSEE